MRMMFAGAIAAIGAWVGFSQPANAAAGWTNFGPIVEINQNPSVPPGDAMVFVKVSVTSNPSDPSTCTVRDGFYLSVTADLQKRLFAMLLMAKASGQNVQIYVTATCHQWGYAEMQGMTLQ